MPDIEQRELQRLRYRQGQMLRSRDLNDQTAIEDHLRWWHNRAVHNAYGVVDGFETDLMNGKAVIKPGVAYDCFGRELILTRDREVKFSRVEDVLPGGITQGTVTALVRYRPPASAIERSNLMGACLSSSHTPSEPALEYKTGRFSFRDGVPVAELGIRKVEGDDGQTRIRVDSVKDIRPLARALARPHIASGATPVSNTDWQLWIEPARNSQGVLKEIFVGFQVNIDTTEAGFTQIPCYFAWAPSLLSDFDEVRNVSVRGFEYRFLAPWAPPVDLTSNPDRAELLISAVKASRLHVCWMGIEHQHREAPGVPPATFAAPILFNLPLTRALMNLIIER